VSQGFARTGFIRIYSHFREQLSWLRDKRSNGRRAYSGHPTKLRSASGALWQEQAPTTPDNTGFVSSVNFV